MTPKNEIHLDAAPFQWLHAIYTFKERKAMARIIQGTLDARGSRFAIVISRFNSLISDRLLSGALHALEHHGATLDEVTVVWVPGSFEISLITKKLVLSQKYDAVRIYQYLIRVFEFIGRKLCKCSFLLSGARFNLHYLALSNFATIGSIHSRF